MELLTNPKQIFAQYFRPDNNSLAEVAIEENYTTYEVSLFLNRATDGDKYVIAKGPVLARIEDMPELLKEAFNVQMIGWCVTLQAQKEAGMAILPPSAKTSSIARRCIYNPNGEQDNDYTLIKIY